MTKGKDEFAGGEQLPESFEPSKYDVIVGWARQNYHHEGNQMLRGIVRENVPRYMAAKTKHDKGLIIVEILEMLRAKSPSGYGLIRQNTETKRWFYIGTDKAKDKIGHALRKASRDFQKGSKGSPIMQQHRASGSSIQGRSNLFPPLTPSSAFSPNSIALKSFKTGPGHAVATNKDGSGLESWPLRSVTSLSSSESHSEELQQQAHQNAVQVTVPSSPVTRPSNVTSNPATATVAQYANQYFPEEKYAWPAPYDGQSRYHHGQYPEGSHHYSGHYPHPEGAAHGTPEQYSHHHSYGGRPHQQHQYHEMPAPPATPSLHRIFDEVEVPHQQHYQAPSREDPYHHQQQYHPTPTSTSESYPEYPRTISSEGLPPN